MASRPSIQDSGRAFAYPRGRGKRRPFEAEEILKEVLFAEMDYKEGGKVRRASRLEIAVRTLAAKAVKGDIASAVLLLKMRTHAKKHGDGGPLVIRIINALPNNNIIRKKISFAANDTVVQRQHP
jgi:hypothetical protein